MSFVAGTLVHTDKGLVPIQDLKVGDLVLSKPVEFLNSNEDEQIQPVYKPILNISKSHEKEDIHKVEYYNSSLYEEKFDEYGDELDSFCDNYIFCTAKQNFWTTFINTPNNFKQSKWCIASQLFTANMFAMYIDNFFEQYEEDVDFPKLTSVLGHEITLSSCAFLPVRTLPNFPEGCAYTHSIGIEDYLWNVEWHECELDDFLQNIWQEYSNIEFVQFDNNHYYLVSLGETDKFFYDDNNGYQMNLPTTDSFTHVNRKAPFNIDIDLYKTLNTRLFQDINPNANHNIDMFKNFYNSPIYFNGQKIADNKLDSANDKRQYEYGIYNLEHYGNDEGLLDLSIHKKMQKLDDPCPNAYKDYVYNLEVADFHTYFVGHDGILVGDTTL